MSLEINNRALVVQKTSALLLISSDMHQSDFAVQCIRLRIITSKKLYGTFYTKMGLVDFIL